METAPNTTIADVTSVVTKGTTPTTLKRSFTSHGISFIKGESITSDGALIPGKLAYIDEETDALLKRSRLQEDDVLFSIAGVIGRTALISQSALPANTNQAIAILRPVKERVLPRFLYYTVRSQTFRNHSLGRVVQTAQANVSLGVLSAAPIWVPPLPVQRRIAGALSAYDELIENSQRRIRILEAMARALYREWFVHFRFPGHEDHARVPSPLGEIPEGWEVKVVKDILSRRKAGTVYRETDVVSEGEVPVLDQSTSELLGFHDNEADHIASPESPLAIFGDHTCKMQLLIEPFSVGPNVVPFSAKPEFSTAYVFYAVNSLVNTQEYKRHWGPLNAREVIVADDATASRFTTLVQPMLMEQEALRRVIRNLRDTRDLLLPRLLSGQLELEVAEA